MINKQVMDDLMEHIIDLAAKNYADRISTVKVKFQKPCSFTTDEFKREFYTAARGTAAETAALEWSMIEQAEDEKTQSDYRNIDPEIQLEEITIENI